MNIKFINESLTVGYVKSLYEITPMCTFVEILQRFEIVGEAGFPFMSPTYDNDVGMGTDGETLATCEEGAVRTSRSQSSWEIGSDLEPGPLSSPKKPLMAEPEKVSSFTSSISNLESLLSTRLPDFRPYICHFKNCLPGQEGHAVMLV